MFSDLESETCVSDIWILFSEEKQDLSLSISSNGSASITVSVEVNGIIYSGVYYSVCACVELSNINNVLNLRLLQDPLSISLKPFYS